MNKIALPMPRAVTDGAYAMQSIISALEVSPAWRRPMSPLSSCRCFFSCESLMPRLLRRRPTIKDSHEKKQRQLDNGLIGRRHAGETCGRIVALPVLSTGRATILPQVSPAWRRPMSPLSSCRCFFSCE
jgi:hypothetical protein